MPGAGTDKTKDMDDARPAPVDRAGRTAARREYRRGRPRHGEFRPVAAARGQAAAGLAQRQGAHHGGRGRPYPRRRRTLRHAARPPSPIAASCLPPPRAPTTRPSRSSARRGPPPRSRRASRPGRPPPFCSAASATGWKTTRLRLPTASSLCRSIRPSPRSIWRRRWRSWPTNGSSLHGGGLPFAMPQKSAPAPKEQLLAFFASVERELEKVEFFRPPDKRANHADQSAQYFHPHGGPPSRISRRCTA